MKIYNYRQSGGPHGFDSVQPVYDTRTHERCGLQALISFLGSPAWVNVQQHQLEPIEQPDYEEIEGLDLEDQLDMLLG